MVTFEELRQASNEAYQAGEVERAKRIKADALQAREFETLRSQSNEAYQAGDKELAVDLRDQALSIQKGMTESAFTGIGRGIKAAPVLMAEGISEDAALAFDFAFDTNSAPEVTKFFKEFRDENDLNPYTSSGKITEELVAFGIGILPPLIVLGRINQGVKLLKAGKKIPVPKSGLFKSADKLANTKTAKALLGSKKKLAAATAGTVLAYETLVTPSNRATLSDTYDVLPDFLRTESDVGLEGREEASRRLRNKLRRGTESGILSLAFDTALPVVGATVRGVGSLPVVGDAVSAVGRATTNAFTMASNYLGSTRIGEGIGKGFNKYLKASGGADSQIFENLQDEISTSEEARRQGVQYFSAFDNATSSFIDALKLPKFRRQKSTEARSSLESFLNGNSTALDGFSKQAQRAGEKLLDLNLRMQDDMLFDIERSLRSIPIRMGGQQATAAMQAKKESLEIAREEILKNQKAQRVYLRRRFDVHENPVSFYSKGIDPDSAVYKEALNEIKTNLRNQNLGLSEQGLEQEARKTLFSSLGMESVYHGMDPKAAAKVMVESLKKGRADNVRLGGPLLDVADDMFIKRKPLMDASPNLQKLMGVRDDLKENFIFTIDNLAQTSGGLRFYRQMAQDPALTKSQGVGLDLLRSGGRPSVIKLDELGEMQSTTAPSSFGSMATRESIEGAEKELQTLGYVKLGEFDNAATFNGSYGDLSGAYVAPEIADAISVGARMGQSPMNEAAALAVQAKGLVQKLAIIPNPLSQIRNILGNMQMLAANGLFGRDMDFVDAARMHSGNLATLDEEGVQSMARMMGEMGVRDSSLLVKAVKELQSVGKDLSVAGKVGEVSTKFFDSLPLMKFFEKTYSESDSFFKVMSVLGERSRYATAISKAVDIEDAAMMSSVQRELIDQGIAKRSTNSRGDMLFLDVLAADTVKDTMPIYSRVGSAVKALDKVPFLGSFTSFASENIRNSVNTMTRGLKELSFKASDQLKQEIGEQKARQLERSMRAIGSQRLTSYISVAGIAPYAATQASMKATGTTQEQMDAAQTQLAPYTAGHQFIVLNNDQRGKMQLVDQSYVAPYSFVYDPVRAALREYSEKGELDKGAAERIASGVWAGLSSYAEPFGSESMAFERLRDSLPSDNPIGRGGKTSLGSPIWRDSDPLGDKVAKGVTHVLGGFIPAYVKMFGEERKGELEEGRLVRSITGTPTAQGLQYTSEEELARIISGFTPITLDLRKDFNFKGKEYLSLRSSAKTAASRAIRDNDTTSQEMISSWNSYLNNLYRDQSKLYADIKAAKKIGLSDPEIRKNLVQVAGLGRREATIIMRGEFAPGLASRDLIKDINLEVREGQARVTDNPPYAEFNRLSNERRLMPLAERTEEPVEVPVEAAPVEMQVTPPVAANPAPTASAAAPVQQADTGLRQFIPSTLLGDFRNMDIARRLGMGQ